MLAAVLVLLLGIVPLQAFSDGTAPPVTRPLSAFAGLARVFRDSFRQADRVAPERAAADLFDFEQLVAAVAGTRELAPGHSLDEYRAAFAGSRDVRLPGDRAALARDDTVYRLYSLGYSPKEIGDMVAGRISRVALDNAQKMLMVGYRADQVSDYLDGQYRRMAAARERSTRGAERALPPAVGMAALAEMHVVRYAAAHSVDPALVRAVIASESGWNQQARSRAGAIGLMQLMPGTARQLGVDPDDIEQNVEGGVRYLAWLLRLFKSEEQALIAYNAGPGFAERYARGQAALYGETREFVRSVLAALKGQGRPR